MTATRRQLQYVDTHKRLFDVAVGLLAKNGYHATTVQDIATAAGVAKGTFFLHYPTKDAVVMELLRQHVAAARAARATVRGGSPLEALRVVLGALAEEMSRGAKTLRSLLAAMVSSDGVRRADALFVELGAELVADVRAAQKAGLIIGKLTAEAVARQLVALFFGASLRFATSEERPDRFAKVLREQVEDNLAVLSAGASHASKRR